MITPTNVKLGRKVTYVFIFFIICAVVLLGCTYPATEIPGLTRAPVDPVNSPVSPQLTSVPTSSVFSKPTELLGTRTVQPRITPPDPTSNPTAHNQVPSIYDIDAVLDYWQHSLSVSEKIAYINLTTDTLTDLLLIVEPNLVPGGFYLNSITWEDGANIDQYEFTANRLQIHLIQPLRPGENIELQINYSLEIPELPGTTTYGRPEAYGYSDRQTNLVDWYPYVPPYVNGEGWLVHSIWDLGEYQVYDTADFYVNLTLAQPVDNFVLAASAPAVQDGNQYSYYLPTARTFALSASTEYEVQTTTIGDLTIYSYSFPYDKLASSQVLLNTSDAVQIYSELIFPYTRASLSVVEADFLDGMEYDGLYFLSHGFYDLYDGTLKGYLTFIAAHETAHQWWYGLVGNDQALEPWLDEALATYMEHIYYEYISSDYQPPRQNTLVNWWWSYRVNFYDPQGWVDSAIYDFGNFRGYRNAVYLNGAIFLDDLRNLIGDEAFFSFLKDYAVTYAHTIATADDFFTVLRSETSQDLDTLISSYFTNGK